MVSIGPISQEREIMKFANYFLNLFALTGLLMLTNGLFSKLPESPKVPRHKTYCATLWNISDEAVSGHVAAGPYNQPQEFFVVYPGKEKFLENLIPETYGAEIIISSPGFFRHQVVFPGCQTLIFDGKEIRPLS